jgi:hypothetical protein
VGGGSSLWVIVMLTITTTIEIVWDISRSFSDFPKWVSIGIELLIRVGAEVPIGDGFFVQIRGHRGPSGLKEYASAEEAGEDQTVEE